MHHRMKSYVEGGTTVYVRVHAYGTKREGIRNTCPVALSDFSTFLRFSITGPLLPIRYFLLEVQCQQMFFLKSFYWGFIILFIQYYSMICRPSDHTVGRPRAEIRTRAGRPRGRDTTPRPPHLRILFILARYKQAAPMV